MRQTIACSLKPRKVKVVLVYYLDGLLGLARETGRRTTSDAYHHRKPTNGVINKQNERDGSLVKSYTRFTVEFTVSIY